MPTADSCAGERRLSPPGGVPVNPPSVWRLAGAGAVWAVAASFPLAALSALVFRFPVPFAGYVSGVRAIPAALFAAFFYNLIGGFAALGCCGAVGGALARRMTSDPHHVLRTARLWGVAVAACGVFLLAILDKLVGPW